LACWVGQDQPVDVTITLGDVPDRLHDLRFESAAVQVSRSGACRVTFPNIGTYLVDPPGREVLVAPAPSVVPSAVRVFLLGTVFGILCHKRGRVPLHASCVRIGNQAVAFAGPSGIGKSTLAAAFLRRGHVVLSDDVAVIDPNAVGGPVVWPAFPRLKLWRDTLDHMQVPIEGLEQGRPELARYHLQVPTFTPEPLPLATVYHLREAVDARHEKIARLRGLSAIRETNESVYRRTIGRSLGGGDRLMFAVRRLCAEVPMHVLARRPALDTLGALVESLEARHATGRLATRMTSPK
jgi:hypothetical protein